jgi:hypothetical protein
MEKIVPEHERKGMKKYLFIASAALRERDCGIFSEMFIFTKTAIYLTQHCASTLSGLFCSHLP